MHRTTTRKLAAALLAGALVAGGAACSDDDGDGDPDVTTPDMAPGARVHVRCVRVVARGLVVAVAGDGAPGDADDE
jgi:hypothetical protein